MNHFISLTALVIIILQVIGSVGSFLNSLHWIVGVVDLNIKLNAQEDFSKTIGWKTIGFIMPSLRTPRFLLVSIVLCLAFVELALGGVGLKLSYGLWEQKAWDWTYTFVLQIITVFLASFYLFLYSSNGTILNLQQSLWSLNTSRMITNTRIIISISILLIYLCLSLVLLLWN